LEHTTLIVLLSLIPLRAVIGETHTFEVARSLRTLDAPAGASPATTFAVNALIFAVTGLVLVLRQWSGKGYRRTGAEWGAAILAVAMCISTWRAGQKHLAIIGSIDFLGFIAYFIALSQLLRRPWQMRLALTVILTTGAVMITKCAYQRFVEWPETVQYYNEHKAELISQNQSNPGFIYDYEQRLRGGSVTGYFSHPNVLASYLILVILAAFGVARSRWGRGSIGTVLIPCTIATAGVVTLAGAQSKGAVAALGIALVAWIVGERLSTTFRNRPKLAVGSAWACLFAIAVGLTVTLQIKPDSLGRSMLFRHFYWRASAAMIHDQDLWGVGAGNFGRFFTRYKDVECPEDVEDPHSWVVRAATEWGVLGLVGLLAVFYGISRRIASGAAGTIVAPTISRCNSPAHPKNTWLDLPEGSLHTSSIIFSSIAIGLILFAGWFIILLDAPPPYIVLTLFIPAVTWFVAFFLTAYEPASGKSLSDAPLGPLLAALAAGLLGFTIHSGIDLAMFTGGAATTFFALLAVVLASRVRCADQSASETSPRRVKHPYAVPATCLLFVGSLCVLYVKASMANKWLTSARRAPSNQELDKYGWPQSSHNYNKAISIYRSDSTAVDERIDVCIHFIATTKQCDDLLAYVVDFCKQDSCNALIHHYRAILYAQRYELTLRASSTTQDSGRRTQALSDLDLAIGCAREALAAHPTSPQRHMFVADLLERRAAASDSSADRVRFNTDASSELQTALNLDARRIYVSPLHRMTKEMREAIEKRIARMRGEPK
jgi:O-Antigen ligase